MPVLETFYTKVVGTTFRGAIPWGSLAAGDRLNLEWEPTNPHGPRHTDGKRAAAIKVVHARTGYHVGYHVGYLGSSDTSAAARICYYLDGIKAVSHPHTFATITEVTGGTIGKDNRGINIVVSVGEVPCPS